MIYDTLQDVDSWLRKNKRKDCVYISNPAKRMIGLYNEISGLWFFAKISLIREDKRIFRIMAKKVREQNGMLRFHIQHVNKLISNLCVGV